MKTRFVRGPFRLMNVMDARDFGVGDFSFSETPLQRLKILYMYRPLEFPSIDSFYLIETHHMGSFFAIKSLNTLLFLHSIEK